MTGRIITTYLTGVIDPQRGEKWEYKSKDTNKLFDSILPHGLNAINNMMMIANHDFGLSLDGTPYEFIREVEISECCNPYLKRWELILEYLNECKEDAVFCVDATDVIMLNNPFNEDFGNMLYVGDEPSTINNQWLIKHHKQSLFESFFKTHKDKPLLNAGIVGGKKEIVQEFLTRLVWYIQNHEIIFSDMAIFNYVLYTEFDGKFVHGRKVTTVFKSYDNENKSNSWWKHK